MFVNKAHYVLVNLTKHELLGKEDLMYEWLHENVCNWSGISDDIKKIRRSKASSKRRTFKHLWKCIKRSLELSHEEGNMEEAPQPAGRIHMCALGLGSLSFGC